MGDAGSLVAGRYQLERRIVPGGIVQAWRAADLETGRQVAVRQLRTTCAARAGRFLAAAEQAAQVCHPGIARIHDYGQTDPPWSPFLVTELVDGSSVAAIMPAGPLDPVWVLELIRQVTSALGAAHSAGLVHQDINPGSLLLAPGGAVKLTGFGLARDAGSPRSDLYRLGLVAWGCLTGSPPASGGTLEASPGQESKPLPPMPATVPEGIAGLAAALLAVGPAARPASAAEVVSRCRELMAVPMRVAEPRRVGSSPGTLLLDPQARRSPNLSRVA